MTASAAAVAATQRHTKRNPCLVCGGFAELPQGHGQRCWGFRSEEGTFEHCTREELAGGLDAETLGSYAHRLNGPCNCGTAHGPAVERRAPERLTSGKLDPKVGAGIETVYRVSDYEHVRLDHLDGRKSYVWRGVDGSRGLGGVSLADLPLYGTERLDDADVGCVAVVTEGEKACDALMGYGLPVGAGCRDDAGAAAWMESWATLLLGAVDRHDDALRGSVLLHHLGLRRTRTRHPR